MDGELTSTAYENENESSHGKHQELKRYFRTRKQELIDQIFKQSERKIVNLLSCD